MMSFITHKAKLNNSFTGIHTATLGCAVGELKPCGLKLYLYLSGNKDGFQWTLNPSAFAAWMGLNYSDSNTSRAVRKVINDGISDLIEKGYLVQKSKDLFDFLEQKVPKKVIVWNKKFLLIDRRKIKHCRSLRSLSMFYLSMRCRGGYRNDYIR